MGKSRKEGERRIGLSRTSMELSKGLMEGKKKSKENIRDFQ